MPVDATPTPLNFYGDADGRALAYVDACQLRWEKLQVSGIDLVRYCTNSSQLLFQVADVNDLNQAVAARRCVMVRTSQSTEEFVGIPGNHSLPKQTGEKRYFDEMRNIDGIKNRYSPK